MNKTTADQTAHRNAAAAIDHLLRKYERMVAPPRHLQFPLVGCGLATLERACLNALRTGNIARARDLWLTHMLERQRIARLEAWMRDVGCGRSRTAWVALAQRIEGAIWRAQEVGAFRGAPGTVADRLADVHAIIRRVELRAQLDRLS